MAITTDVFDPAHVIARLGARLRGDASLAARAPRLLLLVLAVLGALAAASSPAGTQPVQPFQPGAVLPSLRPQRTAIGCLISPEKVAEIGSPVIGIVSKVKVDVGDIVREGQTLVMLRADVESANVEAAQARSAIDADVRAGEANLVLARQRYVRARDLQAQGFVSEQATEQALAEQEVSLQKLRQAKGLQRVSASDVGVARAQLGQRKVTSGFDGIVIERYVNSGERVDDKPMLRIAQLDPLRVELVMPASRYGSVALRERIAISPELPGIAPVQARVTHIDPIIDAASNTFRVRLTLPNPGHKLPGGARCRVDLPAPDAAATTAPVAPIAPAGTLAPSAAPALLPAGTRPSSTRMKVTG